MIFCEDEIYIYLHYSNINKIKGYKLKLMLNYLLNMD